MAEIKEGAKAPNIQATTDAGEKFRLRDLKGKYAVVYFYPKADTPGCTVEAKEFRDARDEFAKANAVIVGVSPDPVSRQCKFKEKYDLNFVLLADEDHSVAEAFGTWGEKSMYGRKYMGVERQTFIIGPDGKIVKIYPKVKAAGHAAQVLADLKAL